MKQASGMSAYQQQQSAAQVRAQAEQIRAQAQQIREQARAIGEQARQQARQQAEQARQQAERQASSNGAQVIEIPSFALPPMPPVPQFPTGTTAPTDFGRPGHARDIPDGAIIITLAFFVTIVLCVIGWPLARAFGRRMDRRTERMSTVPDDMTDRLTRIEQQVEAIAIEVERVSEGQRYSTKLLTEMREIPALQSPAAEQRVPVERG